MHISFLTGQFLFSVQPRSSVANIKEKKSVSPELAARLQRMEGAHAVSVHLYIFAGRSLVSLPFCIERI